MSQQTEVARHCVIISCPHALRQDTINVAFILINLLYTVYYTALLRRQYPPVMDTYSSMHTRNHLSAGSIAHNATAPSLGPILDLL